MTIESEDISVFRVNKKPETAENPKPFQITFCSGPDHQVLKDLGVFNTSVFPANCSIWVEGITDRLYIDHFLNLYMNDLQSKKTEDQPTRSAFKRDLHYAFVEYGGSCIKHTTLFDETGINPDRLFGKAFFILDKPSSEDVDNKLTQKLNESKDIKSKTLDQEVENLLPPKALAEYFGPQGPKKFRGINRPENIVKISEDNLKNRRFGDILVYDCGFPDSWKETSGALNSDRKTHLAQEVRQYITSFSDLPRHTRDLIKEIYDFIAAQNPTVPAPKSDAK